MWRRLGQACAGEPQIQEHLDIAVNDLEASVRWAVEVGVTLAGNRRTTYGSCSTRRVTPSASSSAIRTQRQQSAGGGMWSPAPGSAFLP